MRYQVNLTSSNTIGRYETMQEAIKVAASLVATRAFVRDLLAGTIVYRNW